MKGDPLLVGGAVALICTAILVLFTHIELNLFEWVQCGPIGALQQRQPLACHGPQS